MQNIADKGCHLESDFRIFNSNFVFFINFFWEDAQISYISSPLNY